MTLTSNVAQIDARSIVPAERHALVFNAFKGLGASESLELIHDHDPSSLYQQFQEALPGRFGWAYLEKGPNTWLVRITKQAGSHGNGQCCGSCGGF